jgi:1-acyl-sn-glycerol-3-phosphate acyltransferase
VTVDCDCDCGQAILVYPGGARETFKRVGEEKYKLHWDNKLGFAKAAIRAGCTIIPCTSVGTEDMTEVLYDLPLGWVPLPFLWGSDRTMPIMKMPGLHDLQRIYFAFGEPIRTDHLLGNDSVENCMQIKQRTQAAVEDGIAFLQQLQEADPQRLTIHRSPWLKRVASLFSEIAARGRQAAVDGTEE